MSLAPSAWARCGGCRRRARVHVNATQSLTALQVRSVPQTCSFASFALSASSFVPSSCGGTSLFTSSAEYKGDFKFGRHVLKYAPNPAETHGAVCVRHTGSCHPACG